MDSIEIDVDGQLIAETLQGNQEAFGQLMQKHHSMLYSTACRILKNTQEAEDIVQDSFIQAFRHLSEFNHESRLSTWLYTIVLNRIRNKLRHSKLLRIYPLDVCSPAGDGHRPVDVKDGVPDPEDVLQGQLEREALRRVARRLPSRHKRIFELYYFEQYPIAEIARTVGRPEGTVKVYLHRARKWLTREFQKNPTDVPAESPVASGSR